MKIIISPAKSLDFQSKLPTHRATQPRFLENAALINGILARKSRQSISGLMGISDKLADLNYQRYKAFHRPFTGQNARPAVYAYSGDVYLGLDVYSLPVAKIDRLQKELRILSGMYGLLRPLDLIQPYRLEMGVKLRVSGQKDLYDYWKKTLTETLNQELTKNNFLLNLASREYSKAVDEQKLKTPVISPVFKDFKNGQLKIISFFAKKARGRMVRFILDHEIQDRKGILTFDYDGYAFSERHTEQENQPVFIR